ncbi:MAG: FAD-dependent oxidoreductase [Terracidiphilus sp.]|nr:FAD-dependent oxidoreductase [Terracidiphilus sp.]
MHRKIDFRWAACCLLGGFLAFSANLGLCSPPAADRVYDVVVYGGTSGGVMAAVQAARMGRSALLLEPGRHLGGMTSAGLGATDLGAYPQAVGGLAAEFYRRIYGYYERPSSWTLQSREQFFKTSGWPLLEGRMFTFEPHAAEAVFRQMTAEAGVTVVYGERLDLKNGVIREGNRIQALRMESGRVFAGKMFIDTTYEGDLLPGSGVTYTLGREAAGKYGESYAGVQKRLTVEHQFQFPVDTWQVPGQSSSGLLPGIQHASESSTGAEGSGDGLIQAYNFRLCITDAPENRIPFAKPDGYDPGQFELLARYIQAGFDHPLGLNVAMPNRKFDFNNYGPFSVDFQRGSDNYVEGSYKQREEIVDSHIQYQQGLTWFLAHDTRVPVAVREKLSQWGLCKDEFTETAHWPHQLYVREARRMVSGYVMTQQNVTGLRTVNDSAGLAAYPMDSHNFQRYVDESGHVREEGGIFIAGPGPYPISYRSIVPSRGQAENLFVPWALSASHVAFLSIRMEPVLMILSQTAATAASMAIEQKVAVQDIDYARLRERLLSDGQLLEWKGPNQTPPEAVAAASMRGIVVDDLDNRYGMQDWYCRADGKFVGSSYREARSNSLIRDFRYQAKLPESGEYEVRYAYASAPERASRVPITIVDATGQTTVRVDLRQPPPIDGLWISLGTFRFTAGKPAIVSVGVKDAGGIVVTDAVQFVKEPAH